MSKSRLEKFLYALYSLDSSDLPTPLSRIEELYKCWVTGEEAPAFEPLSRVEKYLMSILGGYDVDSLPNPLSRVEVLLYKLATGDDNLDDVETFLSEHEELLAEIIRNGGAGGNIDIEYVLYTLSTEHNTLYNTAEKPVKNAILKGQTLVNFNHPTSKDEYRIVDEERWQTLTVWSSDYNSWTVKEYMGYKPNTKYFAIVEVVENTLTNLFYSVRGSANTTVFAGNVETLTFEPGETGVKRGMFTSRADFTKVTAGVRSSTETNGTVGTHIKFRIMAVEYQEGMEYWDIPFFEGIKSVKMPVLTAVGKNLFDKDTAILGKKFSGDVIVEHADGFISDYINAKPNTTYTMSNTTTRRVHMCDENKNVIYAPKGGETFTTPDDDRICYLRINGTINELSVYQLEESSSATPYEPYKSNILTVNEDVELHGVGDVKDELDLVTGEVTQRIGEVVFDGSEDWTRSAHAANSPLFYTSFNNLVHKNDYRNSVICDKLMVYADQEDLYYRSTSLNGISAYDDYYVAYPNENWFYIKYTDSEGSVEKLKQWLSQNPVTVRYELIMESVKTVDLSVVNQDGNDTKLSTFNDITHVTLSSEGLIPEAELEVAIKNEEVLNTMSLEMDDISTTQNTLEETSNTQSENVDSTMIATTEIYERLL